VHLFPAGAKAEGYNGRVEESHRYEEGPRRPPVTRALADALWQRCPNCHRGRLFCGWLNRMFPRCPVCGLSYFRESGYYLGGMILTYIFAVMVLIPVYLATLLLPGVPAVTSLSDNQKFVLWLLFTILLSVLFVRPAYSLWLALDFWVDPWTPQEPK
jgi:uncharacterized protein (DUF983 family)